LKNELSFFRIDMIEEVCACDLDPGLIKVSEPRIGAVWGQRLIAKLLANDIGPHVPIAIDQDNRLTNFQVEELCTG
jgi:hypothetical protein